MTLLVRLSSLGDVVLASSVTASLAPVTFFTKPRYADLVARFEGVEAVVTRIEDLGSYERVVDLQSSPWTWSRWPGAERVAMHRLRRWARVALKRPGPIPRVVDRYAEASGGEVAPLPWIPAARSQDFVGVVPAAAHTTKVWPFWRELAARPDAVVFAHPSDGIEWSGKTCIEEGFEGTLGMLARCRVVVGPDTGLVHLAAALGVPVVTLFGPTTEHDGFGGHPGRALGADLSCRPCSRHGSASCPIGDHACMSAIGVEQVAAAIDGIG